MDLATLFGLIAALADRGRHRHEWLAPRLRRRAGDPDGGAGNLRGHRDLHTGEELREAQPSFRQAMFRTEIDPRVAARRVLTLADKARKRGMLSLQGDLYGVATRRSCSARSACWSMACRSTRSSAT
jgi:hypothetical protein